jgi:hypothetical protein
MTGPSAFNREIRSTPPEAVAAAGTPALDRIASADRASPPACAPWAIIVGHTNVPLTPVPPRRLDGLRIAVSGWRGARPGPVPGIRAAAGGVQLDASDHSSYPGPAEVTGAARPVAGQPPT